MLSTVTNLPHSSCWTFQQHSIPRTMTFCWTDYGSPSVYITPPSRGSDHIWPVNNNMFAAVAHTLPPLTSSVVCHRGRSSDRSSSLFPPPTWSRSLHHMAYRYIHSPMIANCTVHVSLQPHRRYRLVSHSVLTASQVGCVPIASNLMLRRLR